MSRNLRHDSLVHLIAFLRTDDGFRAVDALGDLAAVTRALNESRGRWHTAELLAQLAFCEQGAHFFRQYLDGSPVSSAYPAAKSQVRQNDLCAPLVTHTAVAFRRR